MKQLIVAVIFLVCFATAYADSIMVVNTNPSSSRMMVTYEICPLPLKKSGRSDCDPIKHIILDRQQSKKAIEVDNFAFYLKIKRVIAQDDHNAIVALGDFPGSEECKGFSGDTVILDSHGTADIACDRFNKG